MGRSKSIAIGVYRQVRERATRWTTGEPHSRVFCLFPYMGTPSTLPKLFVYPSCCDGYAFPVSAASGSHPNTSFAKPCGVYPLVAMVASCIDFKALRQTFRSPYFKPSLALLINFLIDRRHHALSPHPQRTRAVFALPSAERCTALAAHEGGLGFIPVKHAHWQLPSSVAAQMPWLRWNANRISDGCIFFFWQDGSRC